MTATVKGEFASFGRAGFIVLGVIGILFTVSRGCVAVLDRPFADAEPPPEVQTFEDFVNWQKNIRRCHEVQVRGVTYYHVVGPHARHFASSGALYVFDAKGNFVGWSQDVGDVLRDEAIFYPDWWMPDASSATKITYDALKQRLLGEENGQELRAPAGGRGQTAKSGEDDN